MPFRSDGYISPCIPTRAVKPPAGPDWVHEIKHDGYRLRNHATVRVGARTPARSRLAKLQLLVHGVSGLVGHVLHSRLRICRRLLRIALKFLSGLDRNVIGKGEGILTVITRRLFRLATLHVRVGNFFGNLRRSAVWAMLTATIEVASGFLGFLTREFALLLVLFNLSAAAIGHPYWSIDGDANARWAQFIGLWKDIGLAGGALFLLARGAGRLSLDRKP
jgi:uncharacterized membrane protein YphA (DoxX/SURF4 family)